MIDEIIYIGQYNRELDTIPMIKYKVFKLVDGKREGRPQISYSQIHDEYLNVNASLNINKKIAKDIKFYKNSTLKSAEVEVYLNNEHYRTYKVK